jgi:L-ascorbate metabolism protein UlaG (beta-lactamase superfamily)
MKITKFPQSNFLIESQESRILIDPGIFTFEKYKPSDFGSLNGVLITHQHPDHLNNAAVKALSALGIGVFGNKDVASVLSPESVEVNIVKPNEEFKIGHFKIKPISLPHCKMLWCGICNDKISGENITLDKKCKIHPNEEPKQVDGPPNTGFLINKMFFHPGDGIELKGLKIDNASIPITGPTIDYKRAWDLANTLGAKRIIPMHYSNPAFKADPNEFARKNNGDSEVIVLGDRESTVFDEES